ncbi:MAG: hypothetical protein KF795_07205 [Labilithrix sp.]|nr:hypothetical protein [Labilithrix sp.]
MTPTLPTRATPLRAKPTATGRAAGRHRRPSTTARAHRSVARAARRGAILVEAIIVITFFITCFVGVVYFRELYLQKLRVQRLARSATLAHAMGACEADPRGAIERDIGPRRFESKTESGIPFDAIPTIPALPNADKAPTALERARDTSGDSGLDRITVIRLEGDATTTTREGPDGREGGYRSTPSSTSYVVCSDRTPDERYQGMAQRIAELF